MNKCSPCMNTCSICRKGVKFRRHTTLCTITIVQVWTWLITLFACSLATLFRHFYHCDQKWRTLKTKLSKFVIIESTLKEIKTLLVSFLKRIILAAIWIKKKRGPYSWKMYFFIWLTFLLQRAEGSFLPCLQ